MTSKIIKTNFWVSVKLKQQVFFKTTKIAKFWAVTVFRLAVLIHNKYTNIAQEY